LNAHPWDSGPNIDGDIYFWLSLRHRTRPRRIVVLTHNPDGKCFLRDVRAVIRPKRLFRRGAWSVVPGRLMGDAEFRDRVTIPQSADSTQIVIELDPAAAPRLGRHDVGLACLSKSKGDRPNYVDGSESIIVRRMWVLN
jgi:hypothetical protein